MCIASLRLPVEYMPFPVFGIILASSTGAPHGESGSLARSALFKFRNLSVPKGLARSFTLIKKIANSRQALA